MNALYRCSIFFAIFTCSLYGAAHVARHPSDPSVYYYYIFTSMSDPERPADARASFEQDYVKMNHLNDADILTLKAREEEFAIALMQVRAAAWAVATADEDGQMTRALNVSFRSRITDIGARFVSGLSTEASSHVRTLMGPLIPAQSGRSTGEPLELPLANIRSPHMQTDPGYPNPALVPLPSSFTTCLMGTAPTCPLAVGNYEVPSAFVVPRSNVTIEGAAGGGTALFRTKTGSSWPVSIAEVQGGNQNVTFEYLTFYGNSWQMGQTQTINNTAWFDVDLQQTNRPGGTWVQDNYVSNCTFYDTPGIAIFANYNTFISGNWFYFVTQNPQYHSTANDTGCCAVFVYNNPGTTSSSYIHFTSNYVVGAGGGGTGIKATNVLIQGNYFYDNMQNCGYAGAGSQVGVTDNPGGGTYASNVEIFSNIIVNEPPPANLGTFSFVNNQSPCSSGTELWGTNYTINQNTITNHSYTGIEMENAAYVTMWDNTIENNAGDGIDLNTTTSVPCNGPNPAPTPPTTLFTIEDNYLEYNANGIASTYVITSGNQGNCGTDQFANAQTVSLSGNVISGNGNNNAINWAP